MYSSNSISQLFPGPAKANRLFGLVPVSHEDALVFAHSNNLDITFRMTRALTDFMATLHKNGTGTFRKNEKNGKDAFVSELS